MNFLIFVVLIFLLHDVTNGDIKNNAVVKETSAIGNQTKDEKSLGPKFSTESSLSTLNTIQAKSITTNLSIFDGVNSTNSTKREDIAGEHNETTLHHAQKHVGEKNLALLRTNLNSISESSTKPIPITGKTQNSTDKESASNSGTIAIVIIVIIIILIICAYIYYKKYYQTRYTFIHNYLG